MVELNKDWWKGDRLASEGGTRLVVRKPRKLPSKAYSVQEISKRFDISEDKITRDIRSGELDAYPFGRVWRIGHEDFMDYIDRQARKKGVG